MSNVKRKVRRSKPRFWIRPGLKSNVEMDIIDRFRSGRLKRGVLYRKKDSDPDRPEFIEEITSSNIKPDEKGMLPEKCRE